jgi:L-ascorbate metabolism protein UlaG (beta-lactamase superfamily)
MQLKWYGHASFLATSSDGVRVITDPYSPELCGYAPIADSSEIVIVSSDNDLFHCRADLIAGSPQVINALTLAQTSREITVNGIAIRAVQAMEDLAHHEHDPDQNGLYRFVMDGVHVGHMGDVGNPLSDEQIAFFEGVDVLLALAGGKPTIPLPDLKYVIDGVQPSLVIPMHFRTLRYKPRNTFWIESFLALFDDKQIDFACDTHVTITRDTLPDHTRALILSHAN